MFFSWRNNNYNKIEKYKTIIVFVVVSKLKVWSLIDATPFTRARESKTEKSKRTVQGRAAEKRMEKGSRELMIIE